jgi:hypothetical protein
MEPSERTAHAARAPALNYVAVVGGDADARDVPIGVTIVSTVMVATALSARKMCVIVPPPSGHPNVV